MVKIFPNDVCLDLLAATQFNTDLQRVTAPIVLGLLCGMRPEEVSHEDWGWQYIKFEHGGNIEVPPGVAKDGDQRNFKPQPVALEWLKLAKKLGCELPCTNERKLVDACCALVSIEEWPHDILRKTCATHLSNKYKNDWKVINDLGNSIRILLGHYKKLQTPLPVSAKFWQMSVDKAKERLKQLLQSPRPANAAPTANETAKPANSTESPG